MRYILFTIMFLSACANPGIVQLSPDTYILFKEDKAGIFGNSAKLKAGVIQEANDFAKSKGMVAVPISSRQTEMAPGRFAAFEYQFRILSPEDPEFKRTELLNRKDHSKLEVTIDDKSNNSGDVYSELIKLQDLRVRGILTEEEFLIQKNKLLEN